LRKFSGAKQKKRKTVPHPFLYLKASKRVFWDFDSSTKAVETCCGKSRMECDSYCGTQDRRQKKNEKKLYEMKYQLNLKGEG
jgi:hypothetical protein